MSKVAEVESVDGVEEVIAEPFLKWAGGKRQLLPELRRHVPKKFGRYFEPFLGGGAMFFDVFSDDGEKELVHVLATGRAVLSDANSLLMRTYTAVQTETDLLAATLRGMKIRHSKEFYYETRSKDPPEPSIEAAARMIYLNKTCWNGLWRVNRNGQFNTPFGKHKNPGIFTDSNLHACERMLRGQFLARQDFENVLRAFKVEKGDFVYFDPPYWPAGGYADFTQFTKEPFGPAEQKRLRDFARELKARGVHVLLSNADVKDVRELYAEGFEVRRVDAKRSINSIAKLRGKVGELIIW